MPSQQTGAVCSLCEDTLLRHVSQSRLFWYCPSCRQEMVHEENGTKEEQPDEVVPAIATNLTQITQHLQRTKVTDQTQPVRVRAS